MDLFPDVHMVRKTQLELDELIQQGVFQITRLLKNSEAAISNSTELDSYDNNQQQQQKQRKITSFRGKFFIL